MGPPGSGKGTQVERLADRLGVTRMSTGDLFRSHQAKGTELGLLARSYMEKGEYVPDEVTIGMVMEWIGGTEQSAGFVLDGFPRTLAQAEALDNGVEDAGGIDRVIYIRVSRDELVRRLTGRLVCRGCQTPYHAVSAQPTIEGECDHCGGELYQREDDRPEVVGHRLEVYERETAPVIEYYRGSGNLEEVDGEGTTEEVERALTVAA